jgi:hypothetical protein
VIASGALPGWWRVAPAYRWMLAAEVVVAALGFWWGGLLWRGTGGEAKPAKSGRDGLAD